MTKKPKDAGRTALGIGKSAARRIATATKAAGKKLGKAAVLAGDLNKDGKVDQEDAKIAAAKAKRISSKAADKAGELAKEAAKHDMVKDAAAGAAIGAAVGIPVPIIGPMAGAAHRSDCRSRQESQVCWQSRGSSPRKEIQVLTLAVAAQPSPRNRVASGGPSSIRRTAPRYVLRMDCCAGSMRAAAFGC